jgi:hypothetical protein
VGVAEPLLHCEAACGVQRAEPVCAEEDSDALKHEPDAKRLQRWPLSTDECERAQQRVEQAVIFAERRRVAAQCCSGGGCRSGPSRCRGRPAKRQCVAAGGAAPRGPEGRPLW